MPVPVLNYTNGAAHDEVGGFKLRHPSFYPVGYVHVGHFYKQFPGRDQNCFDDWSVYFDYASSQKAVTNNLLIIVHNNFPEISYVGGGLITAHIKMFTKPEPVNKLLWSLRLIKTKIK